MKSEAPPILFPVHMSVPVVWGEMDAFGHVNNTIYLRYFESVRILYFEKMGLTDLSRPKQGPILANASCRFLFPVTYPDTLLAEAGVSRVGNSSFLMVYRLTSQGHHKLAAEGETLVVWYDYERCRSAPIPPHAREAIENLQHNATAV